MRVGVQLVIVDHLAHNELHLILILHILCTLDGVTRLEECGEG